jgi:hypothetical protein
MVEESLLQSFVLAVDIPKEVNIAIFHRECSTVHNSDRNWSFEIYSESFGREGGGTNVICDALLLILEEPCASATGSSTRVQP